MIQPAIRPPLPADGSALIPAWLDHLAQEEAMLAATLELSRQVRAALIQNNRAGLTEALAQQERAVQPGPELRRERARLREKAAAALGIPADAFTLGKLAPHSTRPLADRLSRFRDRLRQLAQELDQLNRDNAVLVRFNLDFFQQVLVAITGGKPATGCYGPHGNKQTAPLGSLIEARG
jgi:flagellar biosynthesis/type III secretory pathway chaperone